MKDKGMKKIGKAALYLTLITVVSFGIAATIFFVPGGVFAQGGSENRINVDEAKTRSAEGIEEISINTSSIDVVVLPSSESTVRAELKGYVAGFSNDRLPVFTSEKNGNRLVIRGDMNSGVGIGYFEVRLTLTVQVPGSYSGEIRIDTSSGDAAVEGFALDLLNIETSSGDVRLRDTRIGSSKIDTSSGDVELRSVEADELGVDTSSGDFTGNHLLIGELRRTSSSGDTELEGLTGAYEGRASSGRTNVVFDSLARDIEIDSTSGDVRLKIPAGSGFEVDIKTTSGDIDSDFPVTMTVGGKLDDNRLKGSVGNGGGMVRIGASSGDVELIEIP